MKPIRFLAAISFLAAVIIAGLTWVWWPRPAATIVLPGDIPEWWRQASPSPSVGMVLQVDNENHSVRLLRGTTLHDPVQMPDGLLAEQFDSEGNLYCRNTPNASESAGEIFDNQIRLRYPVRNPMEDFSLVRFSLATGLSSCAVSVPTERFVASILSPNLKTYVVALGGDDKPLTLRFHDLPSGRLRCERHFPNRIGLMKSDRERVSCRSWTISRDGRRLFLAEGWNGLNRTTPRGIEVYDCHTGAILVRLPLGSSALAFELSAPTDVGAVHLGLNDWDRALEFFVTGRHDEGAKNEWDDANDFILMHNVDSRTGAPRKSLDDQVQGAKDSVHVMTADADNRRLLQNIVGSDIYRITDADDGTLGILPVTAENINSVNSTLEIQNGRTRLKFTRYRTTSSDDSPILKWMNKIIGRKATTTTTEDVVVYDWAEDDLRVLNHSTPDTWFHGDQVAVACHDPEEDAFILELWDLPLRREPWRWSIPTGCLASAVVCVAFAWLRRWRRAVTRP